MSVNVFFLLPTTHSKMAEVPSSIDLLSFISGAMPALVGLTSVQILCFG